MNTSNLIVFAAWYVFFAVAVIRLYLLFWPPNLRLLKRIGGMLYLFLTWWFVFPFMVSQLREFMAEDDDE